MKYISLPDSEYTYNSKTKFALNKEFDNNIVLNNNYVDELIQMNKPYVDYNHINSYKQLTLLHFSDIHGDAENFKRIVSYYNNFEKYFTNIISTGDNVLSYFEDDFNFWSENSNGKTLITLGNHDVYKQDGSNATVSECYARYFEPHISKWNIISPGNVCYYYKDYSAEKIRLIIIDSFHYDDTQNTWLNNTLSNAITEDLSVIIALHIKPDKIKVINNNTFSTIDFPSSTEHIDSRVATNVDAFINNGGEFITYLGGHEHYDMIGTLETHEKQLCILVENARCNNLWNDNYREKNTKT